MAKPKRKDQIAAQIELQRRLADQKFEDSLKGLSVKEKIQAKRERADQILNNGMSKGKKR